MRCSATIRALILLGIFLLPTTGHAAEVNRRAEEPIEALASRVARDLDLYSNREILRMFLRLEEGERNKFLVLWTREVSTAGRGMDIYSLLKKNLDRDVPPPEEKPPLVDDLALRCAKCELKVESLQDRMDRCREDLSREKRRHTRRTEVVHKVVTPGWVWPAVIISSLVSLITIGVAAGSASSQ